MTLCGNISAALREGFFAFYKWWWEIVWCPLFVECIGKNWVELCNELLGREFCSSGVPRTKVTDQSIIRCGSLRRLLYGAAVFLHDLWCIRNTAQCWLWRLNHNWNVFIWEKRHYCTPLGVFGEVDNNVNNNVKRRTLSIMVPLLPKIVPCVPHVTRGGSLGGASQRKTVPFRRTWIINGYPFNIYATAEELLVV